MEDGSVTEAKPVAVKESSEAEAKLTKRQPAPEGEGEDAKEGPCGLPSKCVML